MSSMMHPGDHEAAAHSAMQDNDYARANIDAMLALASAIERLAEAQNSLVLELIERR